MSTVEVVVMAPVLMAFVLLIVALGRYVTVRGEVEALARDAVRAASLERSASAATTAARSTVAAGAGTHTTCGAPQLGGAFTAGGTITVTVRCTVDYSGLGLIGVPGSASITATSASPLDTYRRTG